MVTLEAILQQFNLLTALKRVEENRGSAGVDGMKTSELRGYLKAHPYQTTASIKQGTYKPLAVRRVLIPKEERGQFRPLGIPTVLDRLVQQAVAQVLVWEYDPIFSESSHAYRPNRGCQTALKQTLEYANKGLEWVVDLDLAKFFDTVNHSKLLQILAKRIKDGRVISLINKFLCAPIRVGKRDVVNKMGTPQGGPVSPILANILLDELDKELERRGHAFVRYADDVMIFCGSKCAAQRTLKSIKSYIERKLFLRVNEQKSKVCRITNRRLKYLGFGFYREKKRGEKGAIKCYPHEKSKRKFIYKLKSLTKRSRGQSFDAFRLVIRWEVCGWMNYFKMGSVQSFAKEVSEWLRRRIRQLYWKQWKRIRTRYLALRKLGASKENAWKWANSRKKYWRIAKSPILHRTLTNKFLKEMGWICPEDCL